MLNVAIEIREQNFTLLIIIPVGRYNSTGLLGSTTPVTLHYCSAGRAWGVSADFGFAAPEREGRGFRSGLAI